MSEDTRVYEIDPNGKYVICLDHALGQAEIEHLRALLERFLHDPNQHIAVLAPGIRLMKVEPEEAANG
jgi:hypothetical protein